MINRIVMPNSAPPIDLAEHAKQTNFSAVDKEALVVWVKLLDDVINKNDREMCFRFKQVCMKVFQSQGFPDAMLHGPWVRPPAPSTRGIADSEGRVQEETA